MLGPNNPSPVQGARSDAALGLKLLLVGALLALVGGWWLSSHEAQTPDEQAALVQDDASQMTSQAQVESGARWLNALPLPIEMVFETLPELGESASDVELNPDGSVLLASKSSVVVYADEVADSVVTPSTHRAAFPNQRFEAIRSAVRLPDGRVLMGGWHGRLLMREGDRIIELVPRSLGVGSIADIKWFDGAVWLAARGLWRLDAVSLQIQATPALADTSLIHLQIHGADLLVAGRRRIWRQRGHQAPELWSDDLPVGLRINTMSLSDHGVMAATTGGLFLITANGRAQLAALPGVWVEQLIEQDGRWWVASWKQGLLLREGGHWFRYGPGQGLAKASVSAMAMDSDDRLWLTLYGGGGRVAPLQNVLERIHHFPWEPRPDPP